MHQIPNVGEHTEALIVVLNIAHRLQNTDLQRLRKNLLDFLSTHAAAGPGDQAARYADVVQSLMLVNAAFELRRVYSYEHFETIPNTSTNAVG